MKDTIKNEPVMTAVLTPVVVAAVGVLVSFGGHVTPEQQEAIIKLIVVIMPLATIAVGWLARQRVTPMHRHQNVLDENAALELRVRALEAKQDGAIGG